MVRQLHPRRASGTSSRITLPATPARIAASCHPPKAHHLMAAPPVENSAAVSASRRRGLMVRGKLMASGIGFAVPFPPMTSPGYRERMQIVIGGHVDHGKSTIIGRLLADTHSLPDGKLEQVQALCERTAKPFEYAFLLDALKDEQAQGITIDVARIFFRSAKRHYLI